MPSSVSVLGLGKMGGALASAFLNAGHKTTVWNRTPTKAQPLAEKGANLAPSAILAIEASDLVILCVLDENAVHETLQGIPGASFDGRVIVNFTTQTAGGARGTAEFVHSLVGSSMVKYVQGAILATPNMVGNPSCMLLFSGDEVAYRSAESDLAVLGSAQFLGTDVGIAPLHDTALLSAMYATFSGFLHSVAVIRAGSNDSRSAKGFTAMLVPFLNAIMGMLRGMAEKIDTGDYTETEANLGMQLVAVDTLIRGSDEVGVASDMLQLLRKLMEKRVEAGGREEDVAVLAKELIKESVKQ